MVRDASSAAIAEADKGDWHMAGQSTTDFSGPALKRFSALVDHVYQGATDSLAWSGIVEDMAEWLDAPKSVIVTGLTAPKDGGFVVPHGIDLGSLELWATRYQPHDIWAKRLSEAGFYEDGVVALGEQLLPKTELIRTVWYREFLSRMDIAKLLTGAVFGINNPIKLPVSCSFFRGERDPDFADNDADKLGLLLPHVSRSLGVMLKLRDAEFRIAASLAALDRLANGTVLIGPAGEITFANKAALRILSEEDGLRLKSLAHASTLGHLQADNAKTQDALRNAIEQALRPDILDTRHFSRFVTLYRPSGRPAYCAQFSSLPLTNEFGSGADAPRAIMFLTDPAEPIHVCHALLREVFGLTPAESRVTTALMEAGTTVEVAEHLGVSVHTLKSHMKSIYAKTNVEDRARLVKLLLSLSQGA